MDSSQYTEWVRQVRARGQAVGGVCAQAVAQVCHQVQTVQQQVHVSIDFTPTYRADTNRCDTNTFIYLYTQHKQCKKRYVVLCIDFTYFCILH